MSGEGLVTPIGLPVSPSHRQPFHHELLRHIHAADDHDRKRSVVAVDLRSETASPPAATNSRIRVVAAWPSIRSAKHSAAATLARRSPLAGYSPLLTEGVAPSVTVKLTGSAATAVPASSIRAAEGDSHWSMLPRGSVPQRTDPRCHHRAAWTSGWPDIGRVWGDHSQGCRYR